MSLENSDTTDESKESLETQEDDLYQQTAFSKWKKPSGRHFFWDLLSSPPIWIGIGAVLFIILLFIFLSTSSNTESSNKEIEIKFTELNRKLNLLENRLTILETNLENFSGSKLSGQKDAFPEIAQFKSRLDHMESSLDHRLDQLSEEIKDIEKSKIVQKESMPIVSKQRTGPRYHTVKKGETLYRISRMHDISLDMLRKLNKLEGNTVYPGQKIQITQ
jgi:LysM repeat protein